MKLVAAFVPVISVGFSSNEDVVEAISKYVDAMCTWFVLIDTSFKDFVAMSVMLIVSITLFVNESVLGRYMLPGVDSITKLDEGSVNVSIDNVGQMMLVEVCKIS